MALVLLLAVARATGQIDQPVYDLVREGLARLRRMHVAVSGRVTETIEILGPTPWEAQPPRQDPGLKGEAVYRRWGTTPGARSYTWLWSGDRYRIDGGLVTNGMREETRCDGALTYQLTERATSERQAWGSIDRPRGTIPTPATFAYMPDCRWAGDLVAEMRLRTVRRIRGPDNRQYIECVGTHRGRYTRIVFDPSRGYAIHEHEADGERVGFVERVTQWNDVKGFSVPVAMEQVMKSGPSRSAPAWRIMHLDLSELRVGTAGEQEFQPKWSEGAQIVNVPEGRMYRYTNGRMEFLMHVGGRTPARMLMGWAIIGAVTVAGALGIRALTRWHRTTKQATT